MQTATYRRQHEEIVRYLNHLHGIADTAPEQDICLDLSRLAGIVKIHLALEDKNMYPRMLEHEDASVRDAAAEYQRTMGDLAPAYLAFHEKWIASGAIEKNRLQFIKDFRGIRDALKKRIELEDANLYGMIDSFNIRLAS